jgi:tetratricopeptide (TPR) repeat protein
MARAFVIRPFGVKKDTAGKEIDFERVHRELIGPALQATAFSGDTTGEIVEPGNIREDMFSLILEADLVICDITIHNANVFYELGIRHALRKKHTILIKGAPAADSPPFDLLTDRYLPYDLGNPGATMLQLVETINAARHSERETDSPIFKMLPTHVEADPSTVQVVPLDFREEIDRARAAQSKGWLRLLAQDVRGRRFEWPGLQLVAAAQWDLKDYEGARESFEAIRDSDPDDVAANLALANIYERLSQRRPELLTNSEHAIERVLASKDLTSTQRAEALALKGRNRKTRWRREFKGLGTVEERRQAAMNQALRESYDAYREVFSHDLNHFWSGLVALQMGTIFLDLSEGDNGAWKFTFNNDREAKAYRQKLVKDVKSLQLLVPASVEAGLMRMHDTDPNRIWAETSEADVLFLTEQRAPRVINRYRDVIPEDKPFVWDAAKGQLQLFADLGVKADLARQVITAIDGRHAAERPLADKPLHVVLFAGHRVDAPDRVTARFPAHQESQAKRLIRESLGALGQDDHFLGLASAAPGADILFHEVCAELGLPNTLCLPMPVADYARLEFKDLDAWRSRFLTLQRGQQRVLELSDREGLPKWLHGSGKDPWERGNRWVLQMALTAEAARITLIALWDGKDEGDAPGGTAHMVRLARDTGRVDVKVIDAKRLLE